MVYHYLYRNLLEEPSQLFDVLVMSDLLHFKASHIDLLQCLKVFPRNHESSRAYVAVADLCEAGGLYGVLEGR
jgi:hypothetical protein